MRGFISPCSHVLIMLVLLQISAALFLNKCPDHLMWTLRAKHLCGVEDKYMCLYDTNEYSFRELCKEEPEFHRPGNIFVISGNLQYFAGRPCTGNRYQPLKWWTNGSSECQFLKSSCNGEGLVHYDNGSSTRDRKCRCDYTNYYSFVSSTKNKCHCDPTKEDCSCYRKRCNEDQVLTPDYDCVGIHEWTGQFVCPEYKQLNIRTETKLPQPTICPDIKKDSPGTVQQSSTRIAVSLISGVLVIISLIIIVRNAYKEEIEQIDTKQSVQKNEVKRMERKFEIEAQDLRKMINKMQAGEQIKKQIEDWEKTEKMFVSTRASDYVIACLQDNSCVTLIGPSGVGKSFISKHTALVLQKEGYTIIPVNTPTDIRDFYQPDKHTVFIVDDMCGSFTANQQKIENWKQLLPVINTIIADNCCKIIVSCKLQVYNDNKFNILLPFKSCVCNLISDKYCLTSEEKTLIAKHYIGTRMNNIDELSQAMDCFPLLCFLSFQTKDEDFKEFFRNPFDVYQYELDELCEQGNEGNDKICSLVLCVLFNNQLQETWLQGVETTEQRHIIKDTCDACGISRIPKTKLKKALDELCGIFICKQNGMYRILHNKLFDFLAHFFGQKIMECLINYGESEFVHERFIWQKSSDDKNSNIDFIIEIPDYNLELYLQRFVKDWSSGSVSFVFSNNNLQVSSFREKLLQQLVQMNTLKQLTLANTQDTMFTSEKLCITPLIGACCNGYTDIVQWLLRNHVNVDQGRYDRKTGLHMASQEGHTAIVRLLLEKNPNVDLCDRDGCSPLMIASINGHTDIVRLLLEKNSHVDLCNSDGCSSLMIASLYGHTDIVRLLLEMNPNVDLCNNNGCSSLYIASRNGHASIVKLLLERNPNVDLCNNYGCSSLYIASQNEHADIVRLLLEKNPNVDLCHCDGSSPLLIASQNGHTDIVSLLLTKNPNVDLCNNNGSSPLYIASHNGHTDVVRLLLKKNPNVNLCHCDGSSPLLIASQNGHTDIVRLLLNKKPNVDLCNNDGRSPLYIASQRGHTVIVELLLQQNSNVDLFDNNKVTALNWACFNKNTHIVNLLLEKNPDVNICGNDGFSPLFTASFNGSIGIVESLLERNPKVDLCDKDNCSPLYMASERGHLGIVRLLLEKNADVNICNREGFTPLIRFCIDSNFSMVELLIKHKANINAQTSDGGNALYFSALNGKTEITRLLLENRADCNICIYRKHVLADIYNKHPAISLYKAKREIFDYLVTVKQLKVADYVGKKSVEYAFGVVAGCSPLQISCFMGWVDVVRCLLEHKANINMKKEDGETSLFYACEIGHTEIVRLLLDSGADTELYRTDGKSPMNIASDNEHNFIVQMITDHTKKKERLSS